MTRKLPWEVSKTARGKEYPSRTTLKRQKLKQIESESSSKSEFPRRNHLKSKIRGLEPPTSPPPEPPSESFMSDGMEHDDKYRMVEDELLSVAQQFTVHLHAAEYKRQQIQVKSHNVETIRSISRPVIGQMSDQTKRKLESAERSELQGNAVDGMLKIKSKDPMDSDGNETGDLPYVGTTLHGLMDSPRKNSASLASRISIQPTTRAAAGFKKGIGYKTTPTKSQNFGRRWSAGRARFQPRQGSTIHSTDDDGDDDLDGPVSALKIPKREFKVEIKQKLSSLSSTKSLPNASSSREVISVSESQIFASMRPIIKHLPQNTSSISISNNRAPRSNHPRRQRPKRELKAEDSKKLDVIPTFL